jgi:hypothetical protein
MAKIDRQASERNSGSEAQLIKTIRAHITAGDKAAQKSNDHYIAAGQHLKTLKANHGGSWAEWEALLRDRIGIGKSRASELMQIADGRKTVEQVQEQANVRKIKHRKFLRSGTEDDDAAADASEFPNLKTTLKPADRKSLWDEGCRVLERMDAPTRRKFFAYQERKYLADFDGAIDHLRQQIEVLEHANAKLRKQLDPGRCEWVNNDGGRAAAGYDEPEGDCVIRAIAVATEKPYAEVREALKEQAAAYAKRYPRAREADRIKRKKNGGYNAPAAVVGYLKSLSWDYTEPKEPTYLRADMLPMGRLVVLVNRHAVAVIDGVIHDTGDCGGRSGKVRVEGYWSQAAAGEIATEAPRPAATEAEPAPIPPADDGVPGFLRRNPDNSLPKVMAP